MPKGNEPPQGGDNPKRRQGRLISAVVVIFTIFVLAYSFTLLQKQTASSSSEATPLQVRTDLMRGQPCHVADKVIMGDCSAEEIAALQAQSQ